MKIKYILAIFCTVIASSAVSMTTEIEKEFGHWVVKKKVDDFDTSLYSCDVDSNWFLPATQREPETSNSYYIRFPYEGKSLANDGTVAIGIIAEFYEWNSAYERWEFASDLVRGGTNYQWKPQPIAAKVDGNKIDFLSATLMEELKGKVALTYRYTAHDLPNSPTYTHTVSLIGFTQALNFAGQLCG